MTLLMRSLKATFLLVLVVSSYSCGVYSFTGNSLSKEYKTFSVQNIGLSAPSSYPTIAQDLTEKLKEYYQRNTNLKQVMADGDIQIEGTIVDYRSDGMAAGASGDKAAMNRLTVTVEVVFTDKFNESQSFDKDFSFYLDFPQSQSLADAEAGLVPKILDQLVLNIFNDTAAKW